MINSYILCMIGTLLGSLFTVSLKDKDYTCAIIIGIVLVLISLVLG